MTTPTLETAPAATTPAAPAPASPLKRFGAIALMFLPMVGYMVGDYLIEHWATAKAIDELVRPYAFNASMILGLVLGLAQMAWVYGKTRTISSYVLQQLALLLAHTLIPLKFGHFVNGLNTIALVGMATAAVYAVDVFFGSPLFKAFPAHFSPEVAHRLDNPHVMRVLRHIQIALVATYLVHNSFLLFGNLLLPKALYLLILPFFAKALWGSFTAFAIAYPQWRKKRAIAQGHAATPVAEPA
jgi:hypothetical protein